MTVEFIQREDCLPLLESQYTPSSRMSPDWMPACATLPLKNDEVDVVDAFATDALLSKLGLTTLEDDWASSPPTTL